MSSVINIALKPNADHASFTLLINKVGTLQLHGAAKGHPTVAISWELTAPDKSVVSKGAASAHITAQILQRNRDLAGYSSRPWTLRLLSATANKVAIPLNQIQLTATLTPAAAISQSGAPILDAKLLLAPKQSQTFPIKIDRVGSLQVNVEPQINLSKISSMTPPSTTVQLFDPAHKLLASGTNRIAHTFGLRDLHAGHSPGASWSVTVTSTATDPQPKACTVVAQVYDTMTIPAPVLQSRLTGILGDPQHGGALKFRISYTEKKKNIVYIKISEDLYFTLDNFGLLDAFETMRSTQYDGTVDKPAPKVPLDPGLDAKSPWYPITTFGGGDEIHNLETAAITTLVGNGGDNKPTITLTVPLIHNPNGQITKFTKEWSNNLEFWKDPGASAEIKQATIRLVLTIVPDGKGSLVFSTVADLPVFSSNLIHLPDWLTSVKGNLTSAVQSKASAALSSASFLPAIFTVLMGGEFRIESATWQNNGFAFRFIPGVEEPPHTVSPNYSARGATSPGTAPKWVSPNLEKIDHIVVLMMENRSFDHVLGHLSLTGKRSDIDGLTPELINSFEPDVRPSPLTETRLPFDPDHSFHPVAVQIGKDPSGKGPMRGFVTSFLEKYPFMSTTGPNRKVGDGVRTGDDPYWIAARRSYEKNAVMRYHTAQTLPYYDFLAREYMVCDRWYSSHPGPTLPNRFFYLMGHLSLDSSGEPQPDNSESSLQLIRGRTIQDALTERGVTWKMYESPPDVCMLRMFARYAFDDTNIRPMTEFLTSARAGTLPSVSFLEPNFHIGKDTNDDHPPCDMANGQRLLQTVHDALTANATAWNKTMLIITYDEHGGLFDHHFPELADRYAAAGQPNLDTHYGVRVPGLVISPWVPPGASTHQVFDHTSILKTIVNRFCPHDPAIMSDRMAFANDLFPLLTLTAPRSSSAPKTTAHAIPLAMTGGSAHDSAAATAAGLMGHESAIHTEPVAARTMIADAREFNAPLPRNSELFAHEVDFHQYMTKLGLMLK